MRLLVSAVVAAALLATNAFAGDVTNAPLAPGKPAGLHQAQATNSLLFWTLGAIAVGAGVFLVASANDNGNRSCPGCSPGSPGPGTSGGSSP